MRKLIKWLPAIIISCNTFHSGAQILNDTAAIRILTEGIRNIYNLDFREAKNAYNMLGKEYPGHPVLNLFSGMMIYWENFPLIPSTVPGLQFESELRSCISKSEKELCPSPGLEAEYLLSNICARGFLLLFYADNDISGEVIPLVRKSYHPMMRTFDFTSSVSDFYYFTGVYNYYRDAYPKVYPIYKTVAFIFPPGDQELGLNQLSICGEKSIALQAEAYFILTWIRMNFETNFELSLPFARHLVDQYPSNPLYKVCYLKNLLLLKRYDEAEKVIGSQGKADNNSFYQAVLHVFNGIIQEKKYRNNLFAGELYSEGIKDLQVFGAYGNEFAAYGYFGLSRIGQESGDKHERRLYRRKANDLADFKKITFDD